MAGQFKIAARLSLTDEASEAIINFNRRVHDAIKPVIKLTRSLRDLSDNIGIGKLCKSLQKANTDIKSFGAEFLGVAKHVAVAGGALVGAGAGIYHMVKSAADVGDTLATQATKIGITTKAWSELNFAAEKLDVSTSDLEVGMTKLNKVIVAAANGDKKLEKLFSGLDVAVKNGDAIRSADKVLMDLADKFKEMQDGPESAALAMEIFGRSGANLIPMLKAGTIEIQEQRNAA